MKKILCLFLVISLLLSVSIGAGAVTVTSGQVDALRNAYVASEGATDITIGDATYSEDGVTVTYSSEKLAAISGAQVTVLVFDAQKPEGSEDDVLPAAGNIIAIDQFAYDGEDLTYTAPVAIPEGAELVVMMGGTDIDVVASKALTEEVVTPPAPTYVKGDATGNNTVDGNDAVTVLKYVVGTETLEGTRLSAADYTENGTVDGNDAVAILQYIVTQ